jgi:hypothetical protein
VDVNVIKKFKSGLPKGRCFDTFLEKLLAILCTKKFLEKGKIRQKLLFENVKKDRSKPHPPRCKISSL